MARVRAHQRKGGSRVRAHDRQNPQSGRRRNVDPAAASRAAADARAADPPSLSPSAQQASDALDRLFSGMLGADQQFAAEAVIVGRRMSRFLLQTGSEMCLRGYARNLSDDEADNQRFSLEDALSLMDDARNSRYLDDGPSLVPNDAVMAPDEFGGSRWYEDHLAAGVASWDDVHEVARDWIARRCEDERFEASPKTLGRFALSIKLLAEDAAGYRMRSSKLNTIWR